MKKTSKKIITIFLALIYIVGLGSYIISNPATAISGQTGLTLLLFLATNLPLLLIIIFRKDTEELQEDIKNKEIKLTLNKKRWESLMALLPQMVYEYKSDLEGHITFINIYGLQLLGYTGRIIKKLNFLDLFDKSDHKKLIDDRQKIIKHRRTIICKLTALKQDGSKFPVVLYSAPIIDEHNKVAGIRSVLIDLSENRKFQETIEELKNLDKIKDDFLNIAAHELKTPLTSILILSELLKTRGSELNKKELDKQSSIIFSEAQRLRKIIDQILTITRFENKRNLAKSEIFDLNAKLKEFAPTLKALVEGRGEKINFEFADDKMPIFANPDKILEVIGNFVDNALKYGEKNQTLKVRAILTDHTIRVEVIDQGKGIPKDKLMTIFSKFGQLDNSYARAQEGIGLGLYICKLIIESYKGQVGVRSIVNQGSTFFFSLPLINDGGLVLTPAAEKSL